MARASLVALGLIVAGCAGNDPAHPFVDVVTSPDEAALEVCADGPTVKGIDVSKWQGAIDWNAVAGDGVKFAFIRVAHGLGLDEDYDFNWQGAKSAGILRGTYQYFSADVDPIAQADLLLSHMGTLGAGDLPPVIDVESVDGQTAETIAANVGTWIDHVQSATGVTPIVYTGYYFWRDNVGSSDVAADAPLWVPNYSATCPLVPDPWTRWAFHQHSSTGSVAGISGNVDLDKFNGDEAALDLLALGEPACGDGFCNGGETNATCAGDCPVCLPIPAAGRIIDDGELCFIGGGPSQYIRVVNDDGYDGDLRWTHTTDDAVEANYGEWTLTFDAAGTYSVEVYTDASYAQSTQAKYVVRHAGVDDEVTIDQTAVDGFQSLGVFSFAAGGDQHVHVADNTGESLAGNVQLAFDALRVLPSTESPDAGTAPDDDAGTAPGDDAGATGQDGGAAVDGGSTWVIIPTSSVEEGGCAQASPSAFGVAASALLLLLRRRRR